MKRILTDGEKEANRIISRDMIVNEFKFKSSRLSNESFFYSVRRTSTDIVSVLFVKDASGVEYPRVFIQTAASETEVRHARTKKHLVYILQAHLGDAYYLNRDELDESFLKNGVDLQTRYTLDDVKEWLTDNGYDYSTMTFNYHKLGLTKNNFIESKEFRIFNDVLSLIRILESEEKNI